MKLETKTLRESNNESPIDRAIRKVTSNTFMLDKSALSSAISHATEQTSSAIKNQGIKTFRTMSGDKDPNKIADNSMNNFIRIAKEHYKNAVDGGLEREEEKVLSDILNIIAGQVSYSLKESKTIKKVDFTEYDRKEVLKHLESFRDYIFANEDSQAMECMDIIAQTFADSKYNELYEKTWYEVEDFFINGDLEGMNEAVMDYWDETVEEAELDLNQGNSIRPEAYEDELEAYEDEFLNENLFKSVKKAILKEISGRNENFKVGKGLEDADFWIYATGSEKNLGKPLKEYGKNRIGVKVLNTERILPAFMYGWFQNLYQQGFWSQYSKGSVIQFITVNDVRELLNVWLV